MKKNPQIENENVEDTKKEQEKELKKGFFKKVWYSIDKIEKYSELSAEGFGRAIKYLILLMMILGLISSVTTVYKTSLEVKNIAQYINEKTPELTYSNGILTVDSETPIIDENANFGKVIIDTNTDSEQTINQYINEVQDDENAIIILKDKLILKEVGLQGTTNYNYKDIFGEMKITEFKKQELVEYLSGTSMMSLYLNLFLVLFIYAFVIYLINTLFYIIVISAFGYLATIILKLKIRYVAVFNMAIYAITLPTILNAIYVAINAFFNYTINYFEVMYVLVASIYMIASIFILKSEFNKKQGEVQQIVEVEKEIKKENELKQEEDKEDKEENKKTEKKDKKKREESEEKNTDGEEPEGSNA